MQRDETTVRGFKAGFVSITGRPNVGKSTLLNQVLGQKVSIVTSHPQTTRNRIVGVHTTKAAQVVFIDTPGIHSPKHGLGAFMVREAEQAIRDVDVVLYMVDSKPIKAEDAKLIKGLLKSDKQVVLAVNKIDKSARSTIIPVLDDYSKRFPDLAALIPVSALTGENVPGLLEKLVELLPEGAMIYPEDMVTDAYERFLAGEFIREKVMAATTEEVPHSVAVSVVRWEEGDSLIRISADIYVEKPGQKGIIIGHRGAMLKEIGTRARADIEGLLGVKVYLELFVKVRDGWRARPSMLADLGFQSKKEQG